MLDAEAKEIDALLAAHRPVATKLMVYMQNQQQEPNVDKMILLSVMELQQAFDACLFYADKFMGMSAVNLRNEDIDKKKLGKEFKIPDEMPGGTDWKGMRDKESAFDVLNTKESDLSEYA